MTMTGDDAQRIQAVAACVAAASTILSCIGILAYRCYIVYRDRNRTRATLRRPVFSYAIDIEILGAELKRPMPSSPPPAHVPPRMRASVDDLPAYEVVGDDQTFLKAPSTGYKTPRHVDRALNNTAADRYSQLTCPRCHFILDACHIGPNRL
ncbi:hypothetical protein EXIGLDRAFT_843685 [Exidia glandulosa HHB12029]|uniref:Uncharacterized protein n=1 Tax=Exidia glandulosa HHB12029 TaxID=1314781 RepID=A0A165CHJ6_EXIGL|nr:hypothetical protein EXIGLDRAFT_843685 [Exidia glandulosa HHB12029]